MSDSSHCRINVDKNDDKEVEEGANDAQQGQDGLLLFLLGLESPHIIQGDDSGAHGPDAQLTWDRTEAMLEIISSSSSITQSEFSSSSQDTSEF